MQTSNSISARRTFLQGSALAFASAIAGSTANGAGKTPSKTYRIGIIGATGRGDYGHHLDLVWRDVPGADIVAVADADPRGREAAGKRLQISALYDDYRQMLAKEKLDVVTVAPRWIDDREAMVVACAEAGCHVLCEKPFAMDAASADRMLAACRSAHVKSAVVHQQRAMPGIRELHAQLADERLGKLLSLRARGKEDHRAGGEDMTVLGCHIFDLMHFFAGSPRWVAGEVLQEGRPITIDDVRQGKESVGPIAGDCISATFGFASGVHGYYESKSAAEDSKMGPVLELTCSKGIVLIVLETGEQLLCLEPALSAARHRKWEPMGSPEWLSMNPPKRFAWTKVQIASDLLRAIEEDCEPITSGVSAAVAIEMVQAVYAAHLANGRVAMPLANREHPLHRNTPSAKA